MVVTLRAVEEVAAVWNGLYAAVLFLCHHGANRSFQRVCLQNELGIEMWEGKKMCGGQCGLSRIESFLRTVGPGKHHLIRRCSMERCRHCRETTNETAIVPGESEHTTHTKAVLQYRSSADSFDLLEVCLDNTGGYHMVKVVNSSNTETSLFDEEL